MSRLNLSPRRLEPVNDELPSRISARSTRPGRLHNMLISNGKQTNYMPTLRANSWRQRQQGQALIEFALVLLFIILPITFVLVDGALMLFTHVEVTNAAREGARAAAIFQCNAPGCTIDPTRHLISNSPRLMLPGCITSTPIFRARISGSVL